jgi:hypothetical protein
MCHLFSLWVDANLTAKSTVTLVQLNYSLALIPISLVAVATVRQDEIMVLRMDVLLAYPGGSDVFGYKVSLLVHSG